MCIEAAALNSVGWVQVAKFEDQLTTAELGADEAVYNLSRADALSGQIP